MAFDIYTDDGQLHRNVPKIQAYKDQQKTQVADFIASNDVPAEPTGTVNITANGTHNVAGKKYAAVNVPGIVPEGSLQITSNGTHDVTNYKYVVANIPSGGNVSITATYSGGSVEAGTSFNSLKSNLAVKMVLPDSSQISVASSDYTLTGTTSAIVEGSNTITVSYGGMTTSFTVTGTAVAPTLVGLEATYNNTTPVAAGTTLAQLNETVKAVYSDGSKSANLTEGTDYQLSGTLTAGQTNQVTVTGKGTYAGLTTTFNVTVEAEQAETVYAKTENFTTPSVGTITVSGLTCYTDTTGTHTTDADFVGAPEKVEVTFLHMTESTVSMPGKITHIVLVHENGVWKVTDISHGGSQEIIYGDNPRANTVTYSNKTITIGGISDLWYTSTSYPLKNFGAGSNSNLAVYKVEVFKNK